MLLAPELFFSADNTHERFDCQRIFFQTLDISLIFNKLTFHFLLNLSCSSSTFSSFLLPSSALLSSQMQLLCYLALTLLCALSLSSSEAPTNCNDNQYLWPLEKPEFCCNKCPPGSVTTANFVPLLIFFFFAPCWRLQVDCGSFCAFQVLVWIPLTTTTTTNVLSAKIVRTGRTNRCTTRL